VNHRCGELASRLLVPPLVSSWVLSLFGGVLIGSAAALLLLTHGRIAGISGITGSLLQSATTDRDWRMAFIGGLLIAGAGAAVVAPHAIGASVRSPLAIVVAGLLVGFGTRMGSGCTSGHGVCGISRWSIRSLIAVTTFMTAGAVTASIASVAS